MPSGNKGLELWAIKLENEKFLPLVFPRGIIDGITVAVKALAAWLLLEAWMLSKGKVT